MAKLESKIPSGPLADKWRTYKSEKLRLVNPDTGIEKTITLVVPVGEVVRTAVDLRAPAP